MNISDEMVKAASIEYLSHRGENPHYLFRGGSYRWETHCPAIRAALEAALGDMEMVGWRYRFEPDLRWHLEEYENTIPKKSEFPRIEVEPLYALKEPRT